MARFCRGQTRQLANLKISLLGLLLATLSSYANGQTLYERPVLIVDPGMHTTLSQTAGIDAAGVFLVTGSQDKTVRIWSTSDGKLVRTIRLPAGPASLGQVLAAAISPDGSIVAAGGWGEGPGIISIYLFDRNTGKLIRRIGGLPASVHVFAFSVDGRYLAAGHGRGLIVFDRDKNWSEVFRDRYGDQSYGAAFAADGRLAASSLDGKVRLYDPGFKLVATQEELRGIPLGRLAFNPDGKVLAVGRGDRPAVELLDGHSVELLPGPDVSGLSGGDLFRVAWSADGQTLLASGGYMDANVIFSVFAWDHAGNGARRSLSAKCASTDNSTGELVPLSDGRLFVEKSDPCFTLLKPDGEILWAVHPPGSDFRNGGMTFSVSPDGAVIDFGFEQLGKSRLRFDLHTLRLSNQWPADDRTRPPRQNGLNIDGWFDSYPKLDGNPIALKEYEISRSLAIHPDGRRFVLGGTGRFTPSMLRASPFGSAPHQDRCGR
jgi:WD40 repeat protein